MRLGGISKIGVQRVDFLFDFLGEVKSMYRAEEKPGRRGEAWRKTGVV